jgi:hypothetical protein
MDTRAEVERRLRLQVPDELWKKAELEGLVGALVAALEAGGKEEERQALAALRSFFTSRMEPKEKSDSIYSTTALARAFAAMQAREVSEQLPFVEQGDLLYPLRVLRERYLQGAFVPVEHIPDWLRQHLSDGEPLPTLSLTLAPKAESRVLEAIRNGQPVQLEQGAVVKVEARCESLHYGGRVYTVRCDGALWWLWQAVQSLVSACGWRECDAVEFALSNRVPDGLPIGVRTEWSLASGLSFLSVRVPLYMQSDEVARVYAQVRRAHKRKARYKGISEFTARFVRLVEEYRLQHPRAKWKAIIAEWNRQHPQEPISEQQAQSLITHYPRSLRLIAEQAQVPEPAPFEVEAQGE